MRRRPIAADAPGAPPAHLRTLTAGTSREKLAWIAARDEWWEATHHEDSSGWLPWLLDGWDQVGDLPWCGSVGDPCGDTDCMCVAWSEHIQRMAGTASLRPPAK